MNNQNQPQIDIEAIRADAKRRWIARNRRVFNLLDLVEITVPFWLVIIAGVLFALSAPHTATIFDKLTPGWGMLAPMGVEFGLLYAAFRRKRSRQSKEIVPKVIWSFEILLFITAIIVNGAGSFMAVVSAASLRDLPFSEMVAGFGLFPAVIQVALVLVPIAAFIIPIGTGIAGEGLAALVLERDRSIDQKDERWKEVQFDELRKAFFQAYIEAGLKPAEAKRQAFILAMGFVDQESPVLRLSHGQGQPVTDSDDQQRQPKTKREHARQLLAANPEWKELSLRDLEAQTGIDKNTWSIAKAGHSHNGNGREK